MNYFFFSLLIFLMFIAIKVYSLNTVTSFNLKKGKFLRLTNTVIDNYHNEVDYGSLKYSIQVNSNGVFNLFIFDKEDQYREYLNIYYNHTYSICSFCNKKNDPRIKFNISRFEYSKDWESFDKIDTKEQFIILDNTGFPSYAYSIEDIDLSITYSVSSLSQEGSYVITIIRFVYYLVLFLIPLVLIGFGFLMFYLNLKFKILKRKSK